MALIERAALVASMVLLGACAEQPGGELLMVSGGTLPTPGKPTDEDEDPDLSTSKSAKALFVSEIYPMLMKEPAGESCGSCHAGAAGPQLLTSNAEGSYKLLADRGDVTLPDNSVLYLHGSTQHTGPALSEAMRTAVETWLLKEAEERGLLPGEEDKPGTTLAQALSAFGACMSYGDWLASGLDQLSATQTAEGKQCMDCHSQGQNNAWLGADASETFVKNTEFPFILRLVTGTVDEEGAFLDLIESKRFVKKGQEQCVSPPCHPDFVLAQQLEDGLSAFYDATKSKYLAGPCTPEMGSGGAGGGGGTSDGDGGKDAGEGGPMDPGGG